MERVQRKKIEYEIKRLNNILNYSLVDEEDKIYINNLIKKLQSQLYKGV